MIRAIVVEDEKLVRKGFISLIDWASYGISIVGEAADGRAALELLEHQETELMFTDITMPGLSGFDLIRQVRFRYPGIHSVILTCHHEFDFVQEALRLGAIDYIVKTLLEMETIDEVMNRIVERIRFEEGSRPRPDAMPGTGSRESLPDCVLALVPAGGAKAGTDCRLLNGIPQDGSPLGGPKAGTAGCSQSGSPLSSPPPGGPKPDAPQLDAELLRLPLLQRHPLIELEAGAWMVPLPRPLTPDEAQSGLGGAAGGRWLAALVTGLAGRPAGEMKALLARQLPKQLFYGLQRANEIAAVTAAELQSAQAAQRPAEPGAEQLTGEAFREWSGLKWALYDADWHDFVRRIAMLRPDGQHIRGFAAALLRDWGRTLIGSPQDTALLAAEAQHMLLWSDWRVWFRRFADLVQRRMLELSFSKEVMYSLIRALLYMRAHAGEKINQADVAAVISMSRSYFSQCFAKFAGQPFGEALRGLRIELAKSLLLNSDAPVYEVAASAGFEDEKYFSRIFRERVGLLPSEYRARGRN
ncbi:response regulator [Paenibacillus pinistramenti]|uniref:response regulator n=1 Tax=Paenibacillus pinistramenti TaxID=1768003 RepID=UPI001107FF92|nr:response regulator [Paenibacillus pinistramenti]